MNQADPNEPNKPPKLVYSVQEAADLLGVCPTSIRRLIKRRILKPVPHLRIKRIPRAQIEKLLGGKA